MAVFGESIILDLLILISTCLLGVYAVLGYLQSKWTRRGIPTSKVHPIFGNVQDAVLCRKNFPDVLRDFYLEHRSKPFIAFYTLTQPAIMINDIELVKNILVKDFSHFTDRTFSPSSADPLQYHHMFSAKGQTWRNLRMKLSPTFTSGKMKKMFELIDACGEELLTCLKKEVGANGDVEMKEMFARFTTDVIATTAFGINGNALKDRESVFRKFLKKSLDLDIWQLIVGSFLTLFPAVGSKFSFTKPDVENFFRKTVWDTVEYRENNNVNRNDFLGLMMQLKNLGRLKDDDPLEDGEVLQQNTEKVDLEGDKFVAQCFLFLLAGHDTSSSTMTGAMYEMALDQDIQKRVHEEITFVLSKYGGKVTYDAVQEMKYLDMVVNETLRKYPVLLFLDRQVTQPYVIPGTGIELTRDDSVMIPVLGLHHDPELYPEPQRFDPERFSEEQRRSRPSCSFLGFGDGPRICIGMRLGLLQTKVGLIHTLLQYEVAPTAATPIPLVFKNAAFPQFKGEIPLRLKKRSV